ncbi:MULTISPECIES: hypothetical protein [unclassified Methylobacterium]|uniref:hypothetical protein n=1 Tax=unclassified Methylobacterium TaxID=2615210 RepID=UPI0036FCE84F
MSLDSGSPTPRGPLAWSIKTTLIVGLAATAFAHHIAKPVDKPVDRAATPRPQAARPIADPEMTGSIGPRLQDRAQETRLDPCALRRGARD